MNFDLPQQFRLFSQLLFQRVDLWSQGREREREGERERERERVGDK